MVAHALPWKELPPVLTSHAQLKGNTLALNHQPLPFGGGLLVPRCMALGTLE